MTKKKIHRCNKVSDFWAGMATASIIIVLATIISWIIGRIVLA
jgi:hypothetical protein